ncbi:MAG: TRAP transporter substrate-binding protein DctP [Lachnospiraceae bacterium]|nr:TRAP transporter substrate-binding protein DctP [Lachnospiraceae bacterium]
MKKKMMAMALAATMVCGMIAAPATASASDYDASGDPAVSLIFTSVSVTGDSHTDAMTAFAEKVEELSGGSVTCRTYSDGTLFSSENELDAVLNGDADLAYISFPTLATQEGLEWCAMIQSAYFWNSYEHMTSVMGGEIGEEIYEKISAAVNLTPLGNFYLGSRVVNTRNKEITCYDDMDGVLLRMPNSETWLNLGEAIGATPTGLSYSELYTALQTGTVDGQENPLPSDISAGFYEVATYFAITNHVVDCILPCINTDTWNSLTEAQQQAVAEAMEYAQEVNDTERIAAEEEAIDFLLEEGCTITYPDLDEFVEKAQEYYNNHPEQTELWDMDLYERIQAAGTETADDAAEAETEAVTE